MQTQHHVPNEDMRAHFARVRAYYDRHLAAIMRSPDHWFDDVYSWEHDAGIQLTPIERSLWHDIRAEGLVLYPQFPVGRYFVDFGNPVWKVAIECDGKQWHVDAQRDAERQASIEALGWSVYRITGKDCHTDTVNTEEENGNLSASLSAARMFIRDIAAKHHQLVIGSFSARRKQQNEALALLAKANK